ncbi:MAG TPA: TIGR03619 family F420-dependent LLM class oxidoreductase [Dehalococcoidia bacterium]|nr:TIGR03619 family F420-dependent LLM class oxidoreductase [Dehalococcoidia bacterium]
MHIGVRITPALDPSVADLARRAEEMGFASVWLSERVVTPLEGHPYDPSIDPWIGLSYVAAVTSRVQLGTCVSQIAVRHPVIMARQLATLDRLSGGRVIVGAGAGWVREEFDATGVDYETRGGRLAEAIRCMRHLWSTPELGWEGRHFKVPPVKILQPSTDGGPPFFIGASNSKGLRRAILHGDGFISVGTTPEALRGIAEDMRARRAEQGFTGDFPIYCQVNPPQAVDEGVALIRDYRDAGADGLVIAEPMGRGDGFPPADAISRAILEEAAG